MLNEKQTNRDTFTQNAMIGVADEHPNYECHFLNFLFFYFFISRKNFYYRLIKNLRRDSKIFHVSTFAKEKKSADKRILAKNHGFQQRLHKYEI